MIAESGSEYFSLSMLCEGSMVFDILQQVCSEGDIVCIVVDSNCDPIVIVKVIVFLIVYVIVYRCHPLCGVC